MIDMRDIEGFEWDEANELKSLAKHGVGPREIEQVFVNSPLLLLNDEKHSLSEKRFHAYGKTSAGRLLQVSFTLRGGETVIRIISARPMSRKERLRYAEEV
jgi:uncharacterized DUF497 family protein